MSESDTEIRRKVRAIAQKAADDLRERGRPVPDHTQAILDDLDAVLAGVDDPYACPICYGHMRKIGIDLYKCSTCGETFEERQWG